LLVRIVSYEMSIRRAVKYINISFTELLWNWNVEVRGWEQGRRRPRPDEGPFLQTVGMLTRVSRSLLRRPSASEIRARPSTCRKIPQSKCMPRR